MFDYTVLDKVEDISPTEKELTELKQLAEIAEKIGSYQWMYKGKFSDGKVHDGIIAQDLLKVPGLKGAVIKSPEDGHLEVDANFVALATLGYVAALTRLIMRAR